MRVAEGPLDGTTLGSAAKFGKQLTLSILGLRARNLALQFIANLPLYCRSLGVSGVDDLMFLRGVRSGRDLI